MKRNMLEWSEIYGIQILDPDGWRLKNSPAKTDEILEDEFYWRMGMSTIWIVDRNKWISKQPS